MTEDETTLKGRVTRQGEEAIGRLAQELLESPVVSGALSAAFETRERAMRAQEIAMGALNIPSAADLERLTRRVRSVSQRLEGIEDGLDRLDERLARASASREIDERLTRIEAMLERLELERPEPESAPAVPVRPASTGAARSSAARSSAVTRAKSAAKTTGSRSGGGRSGRAPSGQSRTRKPAGG